MKKEGKLLEKKIPLVPKTNFQNNSQLSTSSTSITSNTNQTVQFIKKQEQKPAADFKKDLEYIASKQQIGTENAEIQREWLTKVALVLKDWQQDSEISKDSLIKQSLSLIESQDLVVKFYAIRASLIGFLTLNLVEILFGQKQISKPVLRRPKSGSKQQSDLLPSIIYQPQQFMAVLVKAVHLSKEKIFLQLNTEESISPLLFRILKLLSTVPKDVINTPQLIPFLSAIFSILKNSANVSIEQKRMLTMPCLQLIGSYLHTFQIDESYEQDLITLFTVITALLRNLAIEQTSVKAFLDQNVCQNQNFDYLQIIQKLVQSMAEYPKNYELILNNLRQNYD